MDRGRGRARGRARPPQEPQPGRPHQQPAPQQGRPGPAPQQGAWGQRPPAVAPQQQARPGPAPVQQPAPSQGSQMQTVGRGSRPRAGGEEHSVGAVAGGPGGNGGNGNGGVRGRTNRNEIISTRPAHVLTKKGTDGTPILLRANYFQLLSAERWGLNQYRVDFNPPIDDTRTRKRLVAIGIKPYNVTGYLFDGTVLYTPSRLHPDPCDFLVKDEASGQDVAVQIRLVGEVASGDFHYLQLFNLIIRKCFAFMKFELLGRNYYDPHLKVTLQEHNLELWPGFQTSMRQHEQNILLNVDLSFKVLRLDRVYDMLLECGQSRNPRQEFQNKIIGCIVLTHYNNKTYRIDDVDFAQNPDSTFPKRDGSQVSYRRYFEERYRVRIQHDDQPILISRSKKREIRAGMPENVALLPELCIMTGLSDKQRDNFMLMKAMGDHTRVNPGERMKKLQQFSERLAKCPEAIEEIKRWDLKLANNLIQFQSRVLPRETLILKDNRQIQVGDDADWTRDLRSAPMYLTVGVSKLAVICPGRFCSAAQEFCQLLTKAGRGMSMNIAPKVFDIRDDKSQTYLVELERVITEVNPNMVMVVLSNNSGDRYNAVKKKCYVDRAMPCQVMVARTLTNKGAMSIATKVAIQMNCKMGGAPWGTTLPKNTMICGYDVCRDTSNRGKSFAGMVASLDNACTKYYSMTVEHEHEQELSSNIATFMLLACKRYQQTNRVLPERIIMYRDGVGDGQIPYVKDHEVNLIKEKLGAELYQGQPLKMAFIIVSKRINTKIFRAQPAGPKNDFNPPPGTIVDDVVTLPERYDFYIVSQCVRQGTVAPTSYNIIEDSLGIDANRIQRFTYKMCHMYFNWSGTVRVPAPCQYAHKLAFLTAQSLHRSANAALNDTLYYL